MANATLVFLRHDLLYDIRNMGYVVSDVMRTDDEHARHPVADICEDGNIDRVRRTLSLYFAKVGNILRTYTKVEVPDASVDTDRLRHPEQYMLHLKLPNGFSKSTLGYLKELIHNYLVARVLWDWLLLTYPEGAAAWQVRAEELEDAISGVSFGEKGIRRTLRPF